MTRQEELVALLARRDALTTRSAAASVTRIKDIVAVQARIEEIVRELDRERACSAR